MPPSQTPAAFATPVPPDRWLALIDAIQRLAAAQDLPDIIATVRETARAVSGADGVTFVMRDGGYCHYIDESAIGPLWKGKRFPLTACISGWCMLNGRTAAIPDIYVDDRIPHDAYRPTFVQSLVMVPVRLNEPVAAIGSYWSGKRDFDPAEVEILESLARATSVAIANAQMRASLQESGERLSLALSAGDLGAWELEIVNGTLISTPLCRAAFGRAEDGAFHLSDLLDAIDPPDRARVKDALQRAMEGRADVALECRSRWPDGSAHWIELRGRSVRNDAGYPVRLAGVVRDVTAERESRERLAKLQSDLAHAGRLIELGQMVSAFGHEIRQPLTAGSNYLSAAKNFLEDQANSPLASAIEKANNQFRRANTIIDRIRSFARNAEIERTCEDVAHIIAETQELALMDPRHRGVAVTIDIPADLPGANIDKVRTQQVLLNLLRNAFEATEDRDPRYVRIEARLSEEGIEIAVSDSGPGIAPQIAEQLFKAFVTTKDAGMGIGRSICRGIVEAQGGRMWATSEPGQGARFAFTVPAADEPG